MKCKICGGSAKTFGTYDNKVEIKMPDSWETDRSSRCFHIDSCMVPEIAHLWKEGVRTIECCCGHSVVNGYIAVDDASIVLMQNLGYTHQIEKPDRNDLFYPMGIKI